MRLLLLLVHLLHPAPRPYQDMSTHLLRCSRGFLIQSGRCVRDVGQCQHDCR